MARHITRLLFYRHHAFVRIEHTLVLTHNSSELWLRDVGVRFAHRLDERQTARFAPPQDGPGDVFESVLDGKVKAISLLQDQALFFSRMDKDKDARYAIAAYGDEQPRQLAAGTLAGDWAGLDDGCSSITLTLRHLWRQFPKELSAGRDALTSYLWSSRGGRELDLRRDTLLKVWPSEWLNKDYHGKGSYGSYYDRVLDSPAQAQGMAKTHELLLHLHRTAEQPKAQRIADAFTNPVLCLADSGQLYSSEAMGPTPPRDVKRFQLAEGFSEAWFDQYMRVVRSWGDYGFLDYGSGPHVWYRIPNDGLLKGRWMPYVARYSGHIDYGFHAHLWAMYARSGQRKYLEYAEETNRHRMDLCMIHWDGPTAYRDATRGLTGKYRGAFSDSYQPLYWGQSSSLHHQTGTDIRKLYWFYYLRDYRRAHEVAEEYRALVTKLWEHGATCPLREPGRLPRSKTWP